MSGWWRAKNNRVRSGARRPSLDISVENGSEHPLLCPWVFLIQLPHQIFGVLPFGKAVNGTAALDHRKIVFIAETDHIRLI